MDISNNLKTRKVSLASRVATKMFGVFYINRDNLLKDIMVIHGSLPSSLKETFHSLLISHRIIQPEHQNRPFSELRSNYLSKTVTSKKLKALAAEFGTREETKLICEDGPLVLINNPKFQLPLPFPEQRPLASTAGILIASEAPLSFDQILKEHEKHDPNFGKEERKKLKNQLKELREENKVEQTTDGEYFWYNMKDIHLKNGSLFPIHGTKNYISKKMLEKKLNGGKIAQVRGVADSVFAWRNDFEKMQQEGKITKVYGEKGKSYYYFTDELNALALQGKIVFGQTKDGSKLPIHASSEAIAFYRREIYACEIEYIMKELEANYKLKPEEKETFREKLWAIFEMWEEAKIGPSPHKNLYLAKKVAQMKGSSTAVLAALFSLLTHVKTKEILKSHPLFNANEAEEIIEINREYKVARGLPFRIPEDDHHFIQNFMWMLIVLAENPESMRLLLADKLKSLVFRSEDINPEEIIFLYAPLAERFGFTDFPEDLKNALFQIEDKKRFEEYQRKIDEKNEMDLQTAKKYLAGKADLLREELARELGIPKSAIQIKHRRKAEVEVRDKIEIRKQSTLEDIQDLLGLKIIIDCQTGGTEAEKEKKNLEYLDLMKLCLYEKYKLASQQVKDDTANTRKSGWHAITFEGVKTEEGKEVEIQLMTKSMHDDEKFIKVRQAHWCYSIRRLLPSQKFDDYPLELLDRLTGDLERDYPLIHRYFAKNWNFSFFVREGEKLSPNQKENLIKSVLIKKTMLQIKRLPKDATPVDLAAGAGLLQAYGGAEIYSFGFDENDKPNVKKEYISVPDLAVNHQLQNGEIVIIKSAEKTSFASKKGKIIPIEAAKKYAKKPLTIISLKKLLNDKSLKGDANRGKEDLSQFKLTDQQLKTISSRYKFENTEDFYAAVGADLIKTEEVKEFIEKVIVAVESKGGDQILKVKAPDIKGLIYSIFRNLPENVPLTELSSYSYYRLSEKRTEILFRSPSQFEVKVGTVCETLKRVVEAYSERTFPAETFSYSILVRPLEGKWQIRKLVERLYPKNINIATIILPEVKSGEARNGIIEIEIPHKTAEDIEIFDTLIKEIEGYPEVVNIG